MYSSVHMDEHNFKIAIMRGIRYLLAVTDCNWVAINYTHIYSKLCCRYSSFMEIQIHALKKNIKKSYRSEYPHYSARREMKQY